MDRRLDQFAVCRAIRTPSHLVSESGSALRALRSIVPDNSPISFYPFFFFISKQAKLYLQHLLRVPVPHAFQDHTPTDLPCGLDMRLRAAVDLPVEYADQLESLHILRDWK